MRVRAAKFARRTGGVLPRGYFQKTWRVVRRCRGVFVFLSSPTAMSNLADFLALRVGLRKVFFLSEYERPLASRAVQPSASSPALPRRWEAVPNQGHFSRTDWLSGHRDFCIVCQSRAVILTSLRPGFIVLGPRKLTNISMASWYKGLDQFSEVG